MFAGDRPRENMKPSNPAHTAHHSALTGGAVAAVSGWVVALSCLLWHTV